MHCVEAGKVEAWHQQLGLKKWTEVNSFIGFVSSLILRFCLVERGIKFWDLMFPCESQSFGLLLSDCDSLTGEDV